MTTESPLFVGLDIGTSGCRAIAIDSDGEVRGQTEAPLPPPFRNNALAEQDPNEWWPVVCDVLKALTEQIPENRIQSIAIDGTSGTLLLADGTGEPLGPALMYNDSRSINEAAKIAAIAPRESAAHGPTSALAKLLHLLPSPQAHYALHQADWIAGKLRGQFGISDENNCLKLGYDAVNKIWPKWLHQLDIDMSLLPKVVAPGTMIGTVSNNIATELGLSAETQIITGTTDSTAAFIATGASQVGEAVTSLGSTLVMKIVADKPIFSPEHGVYSQPLGDLWLVGGGSNSGGAVLLSYFSKAQLQEMTPKLKPEQATGLDYYPLINPGERFPVCDPSLQPRLSPAPEDDVIFFQAMLEGMAKIEHRGYQLLAELGAPYPVNIYSAGGGAQNPGWTAIRQNLIGVPFIEAKQQQAAYGSALLARKSFQ